jgi:hypothetical protein
MSERVGACLRAGASHNTFFGGQFRDDLRHARGVQRMIFSHR